MIMKFPQEEQGRMRKLSHPWRGPYQVIERNDPDLTISKVYYPQEGSIQVHQERISFCPPGGILIIIIIIIILMTIEARKAQ